MQKRDYSHHVDAHRSFSVRVGFIVLGTLCVALGLLGLFLPVLPATPFMLLAAACYARASPRFYNWLLNTRVFGPAILEWREHRSIPYRTKLTAIGLMALTLSISIIFFVPNAYLQAGLTGLGLVLGLWLYRIPSRDAPQRR